MVLIFSVGKFLALSHIKMSMAQQILDYYLKKKNKLCLPPKRLYRSEELYDY